MGPGRCVAMTLRDCYHRPGPPWSEELYSGGAFSKEASVVKLGLFGLTALVIGATLGAASISSAQTVSPSRTQMSCSAFSKVRNTNETYVLSVDTARKQATVERSDLGKVSASSVASEKAVVLFFDADGGRYAMYVNRETRALNASFMKDGALAKDQLYGSCALAEGERL